MAGREVVIVGAVRTPIGSFLGSLASVPATQLGAVVIREALRRAGAEPSAVDEVIMGNVLQAGEGQAPARQAARHAGLPDTTPAWTLNKVCGSGLKAVISGAQAIALGDAEVVVAGGMESMSNVPYYDRAARSGARMGNVELVDGMIHDGLWDPYDRVHMGVCAEACAQSQDISRAQQDEYAIESTRRAAEAARAGAFRAEIVGVEVPGKKGEATLVTEDDGPKQARPDKIPSLKPVFKKDGTVTAANSSSISDGAAAMVLMRASTAEKLGVKPLARIVAHSQHSQEPNWFTTAPVGALKNLFAKTGWKAEDVDLYEINEAFAVVTMAAMADFKLPHDKVNVHGGATALGHPIGASGARLMTTLIGALRKTGGKRGVATLCIGGGEAVAMAIEMI